MKPPLKRSALAWGLTLLALEGCSLAPAYHPPEVAKPSAFRDIPPGWKVAEPADDQPKGEWWLRFGDPVLNGLEARVSVGNQNLQSALARYEQARALTGIARAPSLPLLNLGVSATRARASQTTSRAVPGADPLSTDHTLSLNLSYEIDVWGRVRNAVQSSDAKLQASAADLQSVRLSVQAELANNYFQLRGYERIQRVLSDTLDGFVQALDLTRRRFEGGLVTELDVHQARLQVENIRTALADNKLKARQLANAVALLAGEPASGFDVPAGVLPLALPELPVALPSSVLERRPDVAAAERRTLAATADIGVARAAYYPTFSLGAGLGFESAHASNWLETPSRFWSIGPQGVLNLFDGGRTRSNVELAQAVLDEASSNYRQVVLTAYREAEDNLVAINELRDEALSQSAAEAAAQGAFDQSRRQYEGGLINFLPVATAQAALAQAQQAGIALQVAQLQVRVQLIKALGGDWHSDWQNGVAANGGGAAKAP